LSTVNPSLQPKHEFIQLPAAKGHRDLVLNANFRTACEKALMQFMLGHNFTNKIEESSANWHRVEGALEFVELLLTLAEETKPPPPKTNYNLPGNRQ
jgi:hypothetical protein